MPPILPVYCDKSFISLHNHRFTNCAAVYPLPAMRFMNLPVAHLNPFCIFELVNAELAGMKHRNLMSGKKMDRGALGRSLPELLNLSWHKPPYTALSADRLANVKRNDGKAIRQYDGNELLFPHQLPIPMAVDRNACAKEGQKPLQKQTRLHVKQLSFPAPEKKFDRIPSVFHVDRDKRLAGIGEPLYLFPVQLSSSPSSP